MKKLWIFIAALGIVCNAHAAEIKAESLNLTAEQNQKLTELKNNLQAEIQPILEEMESSRNRITEIEKKYFEEFWKMLTDEQKAEFSKIKQ